MSQINPIEWPPSYIIKKHRRAKYVKLRASKQKGLEITIPYRYNLKALPLVLEENKDWIIKHLARVELQRNETLPDQISMALMNQLWRIHYQECNAKLEMIQRPHQEIVLVGKIQEKEKCKEKLIDWLKETAKQVLIPLLKEISERTALPYEKVTVRDQQTLWGSCTRDKSISLNYKLIFLPLPLASHVLIHELCHTKHLNHGKAFWHLVSKHDSAWVEHRRSLRHAEEWVPSWI